VCVCVQYQSKVLKESFNIFERWLYLFDQKYSNIVKNIIILIYQFAAQLLVFLDYEKWFLQLSIVA